MEMNANKTQLMWLGTRHASKLPSYLSLNENNWYLSEFRFRRQFFRLRSTCRQANEYGRPCSGIVQGVFPSTSPASCRPFIGRSMEATETHAFVSSRFDYCNSLLYYGVSETVVKINYRTYRTLLPALCARRKKFLTTSHRCCVN